LARLLDQAESNAFELTVRPIHQDRDEGLILLRLDDLDLDAVESLRSAAFMILETAPDSYQCWIAVDKKRLDGSALVADGRKLSGDFTPLAGTRRFARGESARVRIVSGTAGLVLTAKQFSDAAIRPQLENATLQ
jgi:hypothetical protein